MSVRLMPSIPEFVLLFFSTAFVKNCGRGESLQTTTCIKAVVGVSKGLLPVKYICSDKASFCVSQISWRSYDRFKDEVKSGHPHFCGYYQM